MNATVLTKKLLWWLCAGVISIAVAGNATAGTFSISPLRIELDRKHNIGVLTLHNEEDAPLLIQAQIVDWSQDNNEDIARVVSKDLLVTPTVIQVAPNSDQIVRVALRHVENSESELHYRLILSEVPQPKSEKFTGLSVALRMSIPIFIAPANKVQPDLVWNAKWQTDGSLKIEAFNQGKAHLQVTDFEILFADADKLHVNPARYVLPGSHVSWVVKPVASIDHHAALTIHGFSDQGEFRVAVSNVDAQ